MRNVTVTELLEEAFEFADEYLAEVVNIPRRNTIALGYVMGRATIEQMQDEAVNKLVELEKSGYHSRLG